MFVNALSTRRYSNRSCAILFALMGLLFTTIHAHAQETVEEWKAKTIEKYPDLAIPGSPFNKQFVADHSSLQKTEPKLFNNPEWPMLIAQGVAKKLEAKIPGIDTPVEVVPADQKLRVKLVTIEEIKKKWLDELPHTRTLDPNYHKIEKASAEKKQAIETGKFDKLANKEANRINIATLRAAGYTAEAESIQRAQDAQDSQDEIAAANARAEHQRALEQMKLDDIERAVERQAREIEDVNRKLGN